MSALISIPAAAKQSGIPYCTLLRLATEGKIPVVRIPGRRAALVDPDDVSAFIESMKRGGVPGVVLDVGPGQGPVQFPQLTSAERSKLPYYERFRSQGPSPVKVKMKA